MEKTQAEIEKEVAEIDKAIEEDAYWSQFEEREGMNLLTKDAVEFLHDNELVFILRDKIRDLRVEVIKYGGLLELKKRSMWSDFEKEGILGESIDHFFVREVRKLNYLGKDAEQLAAKKKELRNVLTAYSYLMEKFGIEQDLNIDLAQQTPIESFYKGKLSKFRKRATGLCPFHKEDTPSFTIYTDTNSYYCFGCNEGGDVIDFVMKTQNLNFIDAVKRLS